ncbi:MAG: thioredoxin family protein, partial [Thiohalocapsa sp.]
YLFLVLGLSFAGAVQVGGRLMGLGAVGPSRGLGGAFATGALAALVAAPCTAPFMGTALGYAITQPASAAFAIMLSVGLGMALPFVGLLALPRLADRLPRPGAWMERLKQFLAFPMFGTAAWLVWVLGVQTGPSGIGAVLAGSVILALALWLLEQARDARSPWRQTAKTAALGGLVAALWLGTTTVGLAPGPGLASSRSGQAAAWGVGRVVSDGPRAEPFSEAALAAARAEGRPVFVNMTAAWCITCLVNERVALSSKAVARVFEARDMLYLKGDWTNRDPAITDYLAGFGRNGVPIYVLYPADGEPRVLPQLLTESIVLNALEET